MAETDPKTVQDLTAVVRAACLRLTNWDNGDPSCKIRGANPVAADAGQVSNHVGPDNRPKYPFLFFYHFSRGFAVNTI
ncbi:hypothetical protein JRQ81_006186 [Phrynocephalus forsythii]|uniref:Uncharacterized protein n=1 Tax=Phrynocephalus forsythii TaxID=171643 RepID=A0A9Q0XGA3_9SAUR|nr:hypothetical protein JRQ81_006186 [Phrynocephalus forsythii]